MSQAQRFQLLCIWLYAPTKQEQRRYLEVNLDLLSQETERLLHRLIKENDDTGDGQNHLYSMLRLLQDARARGGTMLAVREAYVNEYGGFVLDLPGWLAEIKHYFTYILPPMQKTERIKTGVKFLLREALEQGYNDDRVTPEILAELHYRLGYAFYVDISGQSSKQITTVIEQYETALQTYTFERYPKQYLKLYSALDSVCLHQQGAEVRSRLQR